MTTGFSSELVEKLRTGELDCVVINQTFGQDDFAAREILDEELVVTTGARTAILVPTPVPLHALASLNLVLPSRRHGLRKAIEDVPAPSVQGRPGREDGPELGAVDGERLGRGSLAWLLFTNVYRGLGQDALLVVRVCGPAHVPWTEGPGLIDHERTCSESAERNPEAGLSHEVAELERRGIGFGGIACTALPVVSAAWGAPDESKRSLVCGFTQGRGLRRLRGGCQRWRRDGWCDGRGCYAGCDGNAG